MSCRVGCSQKAPKTDASELAEAVSDTAKAMAGYKKGAAKLGAAATHSLQKDQQQLAEEMADGARESGKAFQQTFNLNPPPEGYEVVTTCADVDEEGHCWKTTDELQKPVRFEDAEPTDLNIKLGDSCTQELLDTFFANQVSKVVTYAMANAAESENVRSAMPVASLRGTRFRMTMATTRQIFSSWNLTLVSIEPFVVKFGTCYDNLEWWQAQDWYTKGSHMRMPDGLEVQITGMRAKVAFEWDLVQDYGLGGLSLGQAPLAVGRAVVGLNGFLILGVDLHDPAKAPIDNCKGKFEFESMEFVGEQLNDKFFAKQIEVFFPEFAAQVADLICYGNTKKRPTSVVDIMGGLNADLKIDNEEGITFGFVGAQEGINYMVSKALSPVDFYMQQDAIWHNDTTTRWKKAKEDQALLAEVGVHKTLGEGRFSHITLPPPAPPAPPAPPPSPPTPPARELPSWLPQKLPSLHGLQLPSFGLVAASPSPAPSEEPAPYSYSGYSYGDETTSERGIGDVGGMSAGATGQMAQSRQATRAAWRSLFRPPAKEAAAAERGGGGGGGGGGVKRSRGFMPAVLPGWQDSKARKGSEVILVMSEGL